ncbi:MAG: AGE family epimerase/isomerase [Bryobacterales bacterium]|nr:AGE family epimerase/isomerase [Bryobacterales bacterium]
MVSRRALIAATAAAPVALASQSRRDPYLTGLRDQYRADLFDDFLPFMDRFAIDHERGGFMCAVDRDGTQVSSDKDSWYEGRGIWVYSFLYRNFGRKPEYLEVARKSVEFVLPLRPSGGGTWPRRFSREGRPLSGSDSQIYGNLFIAEGLAEYAHASGQRRYQDLALEILFEAVSLYDRPDYAPEIGQTYLGPDAQPFPGARILGVWMVLLRAATQILEKGPDPRVEQLADRCVDAILRKHLNPNFGLINELINHDLSRPANEYAQLVYTGHAIETLWMVLFEAIRRRDRKLFDETAAHFRRHVEVAWDDVYGGFFRNLQHVDNNVWSVDKVLWLQEEVLIGMLAVMEHTGAAWAREWFERANRHVREKYPLRQYGFPLWMVSGDRKVTFVRPASRVEHYHHPRHLMLNLLALDRMIARGGRPAGILR